MFIASWNDYYPNAPISYYAKTNVGYQLASNTKITLKYIGNNENQLYYPHSTAISSCDGYFLAAPSSNGNDAILAIDCTGNLKIESSCHQTKGFRPVVCISSDLLEYNSSTSSWDINIK